MKRVNKIIYTAAVAACLTLATSCSKKFVELSPVDRFSDVAVWSDPALIQLTINEVYTGIPHGFSNIMLASIDDESMYNADFGTSNITKSLVNPSDLSIFDANYWCGDRLRLMNWANIYKFVRLTNLFFQNITTSPVEESLKAKMSGEMHFLRAYLYFNLLEMYGGVPLITSAYGLNDDFTVPRNTFEECVNFIKDELNQAAVALPASDNGRATKGAALALKARLLLYAASEFYNSNGSWAGTYEHKELIGYVGGDRAARWQEAKEACKAVMDLGTYSLYMPAPASIEEAQANYTNIFLLHNTSEDIFAKYFSVKIDANWHGYNPGLYNSPNGYHGWGSNTPLGQLVDAYEMSDGSKFSWANPAHAADPYTNREPRFYSSIQYNGAKWRTRPADVISRDPVGVIQTGFWETPTGLIAGLDTRKSPIEDWNGTYTGYFLRKFVDPGVDAQFTKQTQPWRFIRYTEVLLNYAEACIELNQEAEARTYINMIRKRAGMPDITETGPALKDRYRHERMVEMAYEDQRYFDVRRWMIAPQAYTDAMGVDIRYKLLPNNTTATVPTITPIVAQTRAWNNRFYLLPIQLDEINRNAKLFQNPLY